MESDALLVFVIAVITVGYGVAVSWMQERFGKFQDLSPSQKQFVNAFLALVVPYVLPWLNRYWRPEFGDQNEVVYTLAYLAVPLLIWVVTQAAHQVDPAAKE